ncbi:HEPN domain-containing protein [uncultured Actinobacillus sp.]|uniref:HEPN domain-containing protein n=1 Tax=uncultured Actinobacillus sp. TaxID=417616 RepID=UPI0025E8D711|nr:HEPN domain-containing protein [uncultured Actinobacillus sp.]
MTLEEKLANLDKLYNKNKKQFNDNFRLKIYRAISWLTQANRLDDLDHKFITLWISFNAAYAKDLQITRTGDKSTFLQFLKKICSNDNENLFHELIWEKHSQNIIDLLENKFTFQPFWDYHNAMITKEEWLTEFTKEQNRVIKAITSKRTISILIAIFTHLYTIRNQVLHGGSTFNSGVNRKQIKDGCDLLSNFIPPILEIMMKNHNELDWGRPFYPYIKE